MEMIAMAESGLKQQFGGLTRDCLEQFVAEQQEENLHLEFKRLGGPELSLRDDKENLAKALSGFANSDGGIVLWGVNARKSQDHADCADSLEPIARVAALVSRLNGLTSDMVNPAVDGVLHRVVHQSDDGSGFAATLVPRSDAGPHMAKAGLDRYYKRSGDSFLKMEHFDVADMFGRRPKPCLAVQYSIRKAGMSTVGERLVAMLRITLEIQNSGRGLARAPYLGVKSERPLQVSGYGVDGWGHDGLPRLASHDTSYVKFGGMADVVIHPGTSREVLVLVGDYDCSSSPASSLYVPYELAAEGIDLVRGELVIPGDEIIAAIG